MKVELAYEGLGSGVVRSIELDPYMARQIVNNLALHHLRNLLNHGCESEGFCRYCGEHFDPHEAHFPDCVYGAAKAFLDGLAAAPVPPVE